MTSEEPTDELAATRELLERISQPLLTYIQESEDRWSEFKKEMQRKDRWRMSVIILVIILGAVVWYDDTHDEREDCRLANETREIIADGIVDTVRTVMHEVGTDPEDQVRIIAALESSDNIIHLREDRAC